MSQRMCEECGERPANVHLTQILPDQTILSHLCEKCAQEKGIHISATPAQSSESSSAQPDNDAECPQCRLKLSAFRKQGRLGCPHCYTAFEKELDELLVQVHGSCRHMGKRYRLARDSAVETDDIPRLRGELQQAIVSEQFELAASIRDKINSIEIGKASQKGCSSR